MTKIFVDQFYCWPNFPDSFFDNMLHKTRIKASDSPIYLPLSIFVFFFNYYFSYFNYKIALTVLYENAHWANWKYSARAHIVLISRIKALLMCPHCAPERIMSEHVHNALTALILRYYCAPIALLYRSYRTLIAIWARWEWKWARNVLISRL